MTCNCTGSCTCGRWAVLGGRILLGLIFVIAGFSKITGFDNAVVEVAQVFPYPVLFTVLAIIFELGGGLMVMSGFHARLGAWALVVFTVLATLGYHTGPDMLSRMEMLKNVSIIGGLLYVTAFGAGSWSLAKWNTKYCMGGSMCPDCKVSGKTSSKST